MERNPNFENLRRTLLRQGLPDYIPLVEFSVDRDVKAAFLGRQIQSLRDEVEFWVKAGYDFASSRHSQPDPPGPLGGGASGSDSAPARGPRGVQRLLLRRSHRDLGRRGSRRDQQPGRVRALPLA